MIFLYSLLFLSLMMCSVVFGHPGEDSSMHGSRAAADSMRSSSVHQLKACELNHDYRQLQQAAIDRRRSLLANLAQQADSNPSNRRRLSLSSAVATDHKSNISNVNMDTDPSVFFGSTPKCIVEADTTEGPYYVTGELIRNDIVESQEGLPLYVDIQLIDSSTCKPVPKYMVDFWHCNSTGVYSGVVERGNGDFNDKSNSHTTFHRGLYPTDDDGVVQFATTFPGHYQGRATHIHAIISSSGTTFPNNTYEAGAYRHVGQVFFDQDLISTVEKFAPYNTNRASITLNTKDEIYRDETANNFDPIVEYTYINDDINQGIVAWISIAFDTTASLRVRPAGHYDGTVATTADFGDDVVVADQ